MDTKKIPPKKEESQVKSQRLQTSAAKKKTKKFPKIAEKAFFTTLKIPNRVKNFLGKNLHLI